MSNINSGLKANLSCLVSVFGLNSTQLNLTQHEFTDAGEVKHLRLIVRIYLSKLNTKLYVTIILLVLIYLQFRLGRL